MLLARTSREHPSKHLQIQTDSALSRLRHLGLIGIGGVSCDSLVAGIKCVASQLVWLSLSPDLHTAQSVPEQVLCRVLGNGNSPLVGVTSEVLAECKALEHLAVQDVGLSVDTLRRLPPLRTLHITICPLINEHTAILRALENGKIARTIERLDILWYAKAKQKIEFASKMAMRGVHVEFVPNLCDAFTIAASHHFLQLLPGMIQAPLVWPKFV